MERDRKRYKLRYDLVRQGTDDRLAAPDRFMMECAYDVLVDGLYSESDPPRVTSALGQMRAALADFLFNYKLMYEYPDDFHPYLEPIAADRLDTSFGPIIAAFDEDLAAFQTRMQVDIVNTIPKSISYAYGGLVSLKVLGNQQGVVTTATQNYFDAAQPGTLNDLIKNLQAAGASTPNAALSDMMSSLGPAKAVGLVSAIAQTLTPKPAAARLGRGLDMTVTVHPLSGAYGAELDIDLKSTENGGALIQPGSTTVNDDLNSRVSQHDVNTHVRIDSLKLFKISALSSVLARAQTPWKPFDPLFEIPGLSLLVQHGRKPQQVYAQSLVFLDAVIVPTAADLGNGSPMVWDMRETAKDQYEILHSLKRLSPKDLLGDRILQYHQRIVDCLNREYVGKGGEVQVFRGGKSERACDLNDPQLGGAFNVEAVRDKQ